MPAGRPTKYKPEYCEQIVEEFSKGGHVMTFAYRVGVSKQTVYDWCDAHPEFLDAKQRAECAAFEFYNKLSIGLMAGKIKGNATPWVLQMKNRFGYRDRIETSETETDKFRTPANLLPEA